MQNQRLTEGNFHTFVERESCRPETIRSDPGELFRRCAGNHFEMFRASLRDPRRVRFKIFSKAWGKDFRMMRKSDIFCGPKFRCFALYG